MANIQCGYEDECKSKDCINCSRTFCAELEMTTAESICIEDFAVCDIPMFIEERLEEFELMQKVMKKLMHKVFKCEKGDKK